MFLFFLMSKSKQFAYFCTYELLTLGGTSRAIWEVSSQRVTSNEGKWGICFFVTSVCLFWDNLHSCLVVPTPACVPDPMNHRQVRRSLSSSGTPCSIFTLTPGRCPVQLQSDLSGVKGFAQGGLRAAVSLNQRSNPHPHRPGSQTIRSLLPSLLLQIVLFWIWVLQDVLLRFEPQRL